MIQPDPQTIISIVNSLNTDIASSNVRFTEGISQTKSENVIKTDGSIVLKGEGGGLDWFSLVDFSIFFFWMLWKKS